MRASALRMRHVNSTGDERAEAAAECSFLSLLRQHFRASIEGLSHIEALPQGGIFASLFRLRPRSTSPPCGPSHFARGRRRR